MKGRDAAKKPVKIKLETGEKYSWCSCGFSSNQVGYFQTHILSLFLYLLKCF